MIMVFKMGAHLFKYKLCLFLGLLGSPVFCYDLFVTTGPGKIYCLDRTSGNVSNFSIYDLVVKNFISTKDGRLLIQYWHRGNFKRYAYDGNKNIGITNSFPFYNFGLYLIDIGKSHSDENLAYFVFQDEELGGVPREELFRKQIYVRYFFREDKWEVCGRAEYLDHLGKFQEDGYFPERFYPYEPQMKKFQIGFDFINTLYETNNMPLLSSKIKILPIVFKGKDIVLRQNDGYIEVFDKKYWRVTKINHEPVNKIDLGGVIVCNSTLP